MEHRHRKPVADFSLFQDSSIVVITPLSRAAKDWISENVEAESWQWLGRGLAIDQRYAGDIVSGMCEAGLCLEEDS